MPLAGRNIFRGIAPARATGYGRATGPILYERIVATVMRNAPCTSKNAKDHTDGFSSAVSHKY